MSGPALSVPILRGGVATLAPRAQAIILAEQALPELSGHGSPTNVLATYGVCLLSKGYVRLI